MPGFTFVAVPHRFQAGHSRTKRRRTRIDVHGHGTAPAGTDNDIGLVLVELGLGDADGRIEIVVGQGRVQDLVAVVLEVGRLHAARCRLPAVEEEDSHGRPTSLYPSFLAWAKSASALAVSPFALYARPRPNMLLPFWLSRMASV